MTQNTPKSLSDLTKRVTKHVKFKAGLVGENIQEGTVTLDFPARLVSEQEREMLSRLFPHCEEEVEKLLDIEAAIEFIVV